MMGHSPLGLAITRFCEESRLVEMFKDFNRDEMRIMWDGIGDNSCFGPYSCDDIHGYMNLTLDGEYCAV